jgi:hypothetical protein
LGNEFRLADPWFKLFGGHVFQDPEGQGSRVRHRAENGGILTVLPLILLIFWLVRVRFTNAYKGRSMPLAPTSFVDTDACGNNPDTTVVKPEMSVMIAS